ncbi:hypothetical protein CORAM0001_1656 [Corynebacterium amycolatum SK46]|nr:hypothetical protein CORAM0001_1656 [Corynebacterium amycolatum SK46]
MFLILLGGERQRKSIFSELWITLSGSNAGRRAVDNFRAVNPG